MHIWLFLQHARAKLTCRGTSDTPPTVEDMLCHFAKDCPKGDVKLSTYYLVYQFCTTLVYTEPLLRVTPVAGRMSDFSGEIFRERNF